MDGSQFFLVIVYFIYLFIYFIAQTEYGESNGIFNLI